MSKSKPDYIVKVPIERTPPAKTYWQTIGAAWVNGDAINLQLDALPIGGRIVLFKPKADDVTEEGGAQ